MTQPYLHIHGNDLHGPHSPPLNSLNELVEVCKWSPRTPQTQSCHVSHVLGFTGTCGTGIHYSGFGQQTLNLKHDLSSFGWLRSTLIEQIQKCYEVNICRRFNSTATLTVKWSGPFYIPYLVNTCSEFK